MPVELSPHEAPPNMVNSFMTRYDYDYNKGDPQLRPLVADGAESGHAKNRPLFGKGSTVDWRSVNHTDFVNRRGVSIPSNLPEIAMAAGKSRVLATAHIRGQPSMAGVPWNEDATVSTYRDHYPRKFTTAPNGGKYAGNMTTQYKPYLLAIDSLDDDGVGKAKKPKGWRPGDSDGGRIGEGLRRPQDTMTVFGPLSGDGQPWGTEYGTYGNRSLDKPQLLPKGLGDATADADRGMANKRALLNLLAGRRAQTCGVRRPEFDTNPIPMNPKERELCRVARRVPLEGPVDMTIYQSDFAKQGNKPELHDAPKDKAQGSMFVNSKVPPQPPKDTHPTITRALERRGMGEIRDRHLHKYHPRDGYSSPNDTMHSTAGTTMLSPANRSVRAASSPAKPASAGSWGTGGGSGSGTFGASSKRVVIDA